jgi:dimethylaniline monooxygenase (N-oxide forming)
VAVIGAGVAGLATAKVLREDGFDVAIYEKEETMGGVWAASRAYLGLRTNNPRETYAFSDFSYPPGTDEFPTAKQVQDYLEAYARHFGLHVQTGTEVVSVTDGAKGRRDPFEVVFRPTGAKNTGHARGFDFVAVCNGVFSTPRIPRIEGQETFRGRVLHSSDVRSGEELRGKRVIVIGAGKSALDCASAAARLAGSCTLVCRRPHWMMPRYFGRIRVDRLFFTRLAESLLPAYHDATRLEEGLRLLARPFLWLWWRAQGRLIIHLCGMPKSMIPADPLPSGIETIGIGKEFYDVLREGRVRARQGHVVRYDGDTIVLDSGERLNADVIVFATGWRQDVPFLSADLRRELRKDGYFRLYRYILPPSQRRLGFVGYASSGLSTLTSEICAHWLSQCFQSKLALPDRDEMEREIERVRRWTARVYPDRQEGYFVGAYVSRYIDELMRDMGLATRRAPGVFAEHLMPYWPERYRNVSRELLPDASL